MNLSKVNRDLQPLVIFEGDVNQSPGHFCWFWVTFLTDSYHGIHFHMWEMSFKHLGSKSKVFFKKRPIIRSYTFGGETNTRETHQFLRPFRHQKLKPHSFEKSFSDSKNHDIQVG